MQDEVTIPRTEFNKLIDTIHSLKVVDAGPGLFTIKEASRYLKCSTVSFWKIRKEANIQPVYIGKKPLFQKSDLDQYINSQNKNLKTPKELYDLFGIPRIVLLQMELERKIKAYYTGQSIKYSISEINKAIQEKKEELDHG